MRQHVSTGILSSDEQIVAIGRGREWFGDLQALPRRNTGYHRLESARKRYFGPKNCICHRVIDYSPRDTGIITLVHEKGPLLQIPAHGPETSAEPRNSDPTRINELSS